MLSMSQKTNPSKEIPEAIDNAKIKKQGADLISEPDHQIPETINKNVKIQEQRVRDKDYEKDIMTNFA